MSASLSFTCAAAAAADIPQDLCQNVLQLNGIFCPHSYRNGVVTKWVVFICLFFYSGVLVTASVRILSPQVSLLFVCFCVLEVLAYLFNINFHLFQLLLRSNSRRGFHIAVMSGTSLNIYVIRPCVVWNVSISARSVCHRCVSGLTTRFIETFLRFSTSFMKEAKWRRNIACDFSAVPTIHNLYRNLAK